MSSKTQARPYAQAIFEHSDGWLDDLQQVVTAIREPGVTMLIDSPKLAYKEKAEIFIGLFEGEIEKRTANFLKVLGEAKRLSLLPEILREYKKLEADKNNLKEVQINSKLGSRLPPAGPLAFRYLLTFSDSPDATLACEDGC